MFDLKMLGQKDLERKLGKMDSKLQSKVMKEAMKTSMQPVQALAKQRAPHDRGLLRKSIRIAVSSKRSGVSAMVRTGTKKQLKIPMNEKYYYPTAHEYGTRYMPARSFLRSSLNDLKETVLGSVASHVRRLLESTK